MCKAAGLLCGLAALREFKQIIHLSLFTDAHTHTQPSRGMLTVFISAQTLGNKAWTLSAPRPAAYFCLPDKHRPSPGGDAGPRAPPAGEAGEFWLVCDSTCLLITELTVS